MAAWPCKRTLHHLFAVLAHFIYGCACIYMQVCDVDQLEEVVEHRLGCAPNMKYFYNPKQGGYTGSPHQYNCTYFSALHGNPRHYLLARAIQFFTPGLPMVYYVGLLAGRNDHEVRKSTAATSSWQLIKGHE